MTQGVPDPVFRDEGDYQRLREVLLGAGFTPDGIARAMGVGSLEKFKGLPRPTMAALTGHNRAIDAFVRLFVMHEPVAVQALADAIAPMLIEDWTAAGIVEVRGFFAHPAMGITHFDDLLLLHDTRMEIGPTYVMGVAGTSASLAYQAILAPARLALDLGTGCGVMAFLAARRCERVLATDKNPRAIAVARFNARLNAITNVDFAVGDLYEPAKGYLRAMGAPGFDFIYCNPPFVIAPSLQYMYRDSGLPGDAIVEAVARGAGPLLAEGGIAQFVCNWIQPVQGTWQARLTSWLEGSGCDALIFSTRTIGPLDYASIWIEETEKAATIDERWKQLARWMEAYEALGIKAVSYGLFNMRKRTPTPEAPNWVAFDEAPEHLASVAGTHILHMLGARTFLATLGAQADARLADSVLWWSPHLRIDQRLAPASTAPGATWRNERIEIRLAQGYAFPRMMDERQVEFIKALDGVRTVRQAAEQAAATSKAPVAALLPVVLKLCRQLLERGYVLPPGVPRE